MATEQYHPCGICSSTRDLCVYCGGPDPTDTVSDIAVEQPRRWRRSEIVDIFQSHEGMRMDTYSDGTGVHAIRVTELPTGVVREFTREGAYFVERAKETP